MARLAAHERTHTRIFLSAEVDFLKCSAALAGTGWTCEKNLTTARTPCLESGTKSLIWPALSFEWLVIGVNEMWLCLILS
jgi:hypothetical protein